MTIVQLYIYVPKIPKNVYIKYYFLKKPLFPMTTREIVGVCVLGLVIGLANGGGIGGG